MSDLIKLDYGDRPVLRSPDDGYFDATSMCQAMGKRFANWQRTQESTDYLSALSFDLGVPVHCLIREGAHKGRGGGRGHTWIHPLAAIRLAQWLSPEFAVQVDKWVHAGATARRDDTQTLSGRLEQMSILAREIEYHLAQIDSRQKMLESLSKGLNLGAVKTPKQNPLIVTGSIADARKALMLLADAPEGDRLLDSEGPVRFPDGRVLVGQSWIYREAPGCGPFLRPYREIIIKRINHRQTRFWKVNLEEASKTI